MSSIKDNFSIHRPFTVSDTFSCIPLEELPLIVTTTLISSTTGHLTVTPKANDIIASTNPQIRWRVFEVDSTPVKIDRSCFLLTPTADISPLALLAFSYRIPLPINSGTYGTEYHFNSLLGCTIPPIFPENLSKFRNCMLRVQHLKELQKQSQLKMQQLEYALTKIPFTIST